MRKALFPGSFNPFTKGHQDIATRALALFDEVIIAVGINIGKGECSDDADRRADEIRRLFSDNPRVSVLTYDSLTADLVAETGACCIIRGLRNDRDLEYENRIATANYSLFGVDTVFLLADPTLKEVSSSLVRELKRFGKDISGLIPEK